MKRLWLSMVVCLPASALADTPTIPSTLSTAPFASYDEAPGTVDADDPAIWVHPERASESLVIGTLKDAGLVVYDLRGRVVQYISPSNLPTILPQDPPTPVGVNLAPPEPCLESEEGETFGRFNNVDVAYGVRLGGKKRDVAVVTDRGCDRLRVYAIDPNHPHGPLVDITSKDAPRVYPWRVVQPSPLQSAELEAGLQDGPIDEQDTAYGVGLWHDGDDLYAFISQRNRSTVLQVRLITDRKGAVTYKPVRVFLFNPNFRLKTFNWTPCRENANEDPQSEGIVVDHDRELLYVAFETIGIYRIPLRRKLPLVMQVGREFLFEPAKSFGQAYSATPDEDEFACEYRPEGEPEEGAIIATGDPTFAGKNLEVDVEGLAIYRTGKQSGYLIASSQGDDTFHIYDRRGSNKYFGAFTVQDTGESDGVTVADTPLGRQFPAGLVVVQNGEAADLPDPSDINGFEYDGSTQFRYVDWRRIARALGLDSADR